MENIVQLNAGLNSLQYKNSNYQEFKVVDPKPRIIHKASVRDRLVHHAIYRIFYSDFDKIFIFDCYSCRKSKGTHRAFARLIDFSRKQSKNYCKSCWALKIDIKKFFHSIDHQILLKLLSNKVSDPKAIWLLGQVVESFHSSPNKGMPLGNLTSQLFANIYLDPLDRFIKHKMRVKYYLRYADDLLILAQDKQTLAVYLLDIQKFIEDIKLVIHPEKIFYRKLTWGIDFVGYEIHKQFNLPRRKTVKRISRNLHRSSKEELEKSLPSYLGYLKHTNAFSLSKKLQNGFKKISTDTIEISR